ncbi:Na-translocating system protein MpsC family protein [uncultured Metabacillus sp.]
MKNKLKEMMDAKIVSIFTDINIEIDTAMTVFVFDKPIMVVSDSKN